MCVGVEYLNLLKAKYEKKIIDNNFCIPKLFKKLLKTCFFIKKYTFTICVVCVWIVICMYFFFEKQANIGLLKVIGIQIIFIADKLYLHSLFFSRQY